MINISITNWRKASYSSDIGGTDCVETGWTADTVGYRNSKDPTVAELVVPHAAARQFLSTIRRGAAR